MIKWIVIGLLVAGFILMFLGDRFGENGSGCAECGVRPAIAVQVGRSFIVIAGLLIIIFGTHTILTY